MANYDSFLAALAVGPEKSLIALAVICCALCLFVFSEDAKV